MPTLAYDVSRLEAATLRVRAQRARTRRRNSGTFAFMRAVVFGCAVVTMGCGTQGTDAPSMEPFLLETTDCALVNNFTVDGTATAHTGCRMYWSGMPSNMLTVELTIPNMTGWTKIQSVKKIRAGQDTSTRAISHSRIATRDRRLSLRRCDRVAL